MRPFAQTESNRPRSARQCRRGFTLIELLTIVAVVAILAGIAVPNFLDAQVRSKVAASVDEMHTLGGALEAYWIEQRAYPPNLVKMVVAPAEPGGRPGVVGSRRIELEGNRRLCETSETAVTRMGPTASAPAGFDFSVAYNGAALIRLTTPMAYVAHLPEDRFFSRGWGPAFSYRLPAIGGASTTTSLTFNLSDMRPYGYFNFTEIAPDGLPLAGFGRTVTYVITSFGPDIRDSFTDATIPFPAYYDPTNGTMSGGDLILPGSQ
jgi:prepilin-type N-terminal cleavage/methylation domain-containing protein